MKLKPIRQKLSRNLFILVPILSIFLMILGYFLLNVLSPYLNQYNPGEGVVEANIAQLEQASESDSNAESEGNLKEDQVPAQDLIKNYNRLIMPKLGIDLGIYTSGYDAMDKGVWHRFSEMGDPTKVGNFILTGHRFTLGNSPAETTYKSPFFHIGRMGIGDDIFVEWDSKIYHYKIDKMYEVEPTQTDIEDQIDYKRLTFYTCTLGGHEEGRVVIEALPAN